MAVYDPKPLSMLERQELIDKHKAEVKRINAEIVRLEKGLADDQEKIEQAVKKAITNT